MRYKINGLVIKSENAARSDKQQSSFLRDLILSEQNVKSVLDFGCGKLRYSEVLVRNSSCQVFVDSSIQLNRTQIVHNTKTTVEKFISLNYEKAKVCKVEDLHELNRKFDFILCSNVISAIPSFEERSKAIIRIKLLLQEKGRALFVCKYRDSYFSKYKKRSNCIEYLDGYITKNKNSYTFYGLITPEILEKLLIENGMAILKKIDKNGSIYIYANAN